MQRNFLNTPYAPLLGDHCDQVSVLSKKMCKEMHFNCKTTVHAQGQTFDLELLNTPYLPLTNDDSHNHPM